MIQVKNPFGKREGKIILISDLTEAERGRKCKCVCPQCEGNFLARMGQERQPHFAHDGEPCDSVKAIITAIYQLMAESLDEKGTFTYPSLYGLFYGCKYDHAASMDEIRRSVTFSDYSDGEADDFEIIIPGRKFHVGKVEIRRNSKNLPVAMILTEQKSMHELAVVLIPPDTICKTPKPTSFDGLPTVAISIDEDLYTIKSEQLKMEMRDCVERKEWISSRKKDEWLDKCMRKQHSWYEKWKKQKEEEAAKSREFFEKNSNKLISKAVERQQETKPRQFPQLSKEEIAGISQSLKRRISVIPDKIVQDDEGRRWCYCDKCMEWKPEIYMVSYGGFGDAINRGICRECSRGKK